MEFFAYQLAFAALSILGIRVLVPWNWKNNHCTFRPSFSAESQAWNVRLKRASRHIRGPKRGRYVHKLLNVGKRWNYSGNCALACLAFIVDIWQSFYLVPRPKKKHKEHTEKKRYRKHYLAHIISSAASVHAFWLSLRITNAWSVLELANSIPKIRNSLDGQRACLYSPPTIGDNLGLLSYLSH